MTQCPCGSGASYAACCGPLLDNSEQAATPEALMRSRYTAYARCDVDHLFRTWHPRTRPVDLAVDPTVRWTGLRIIDAVGDQVEFEATYDTPDGSYDLRERSLFVKRAGRWVYLGPADLDLQAPAPPAS